MENLQPIFTKMNMETEGATANGLLKRLEVSVPVDIRKLTSLIFLSVSAINNLTAEIELATSLGTLARFFNSTDDASSLKSHNDHLDRIIVEANVS
jgi:hypothetical protein